ncbi:increased rDNA silencing protein 4 [Chaetomium fimeti]|uniref:Increased rDNA silencing protein 4 n=1 Tax=Chaetomium fimeti TaxID=1854472 RepID=A0AAE0HFT5_9PEZI|nr:increased rDNA silencing protein 4 [Chaetomium fimeti]
MQPPSSPTRPTHPHSRNTIVPSTPTLSTAPPPGGHAAATNPAVSAALQGATLAFNKQKKAAVAAAQQQQQQRGGVGRGPSPARPSQQSPQLQPQHQQQQHQQQKQQQQKQNSGAVVGSGPAPRGGNGALLAATQAARGHSAAAASRGGMKEVGSTTATETGTGTGLEGGHGQGGLVVQRMLDLHASGGGGGSTLLPPPGGRSGADSSGKRASSTSPSMIAATLAASRSVSPARGPIPQLDLNGGKVTRKRGQSVGAASVAAGTVGLGVVGGMRQEAEVLDTASIPPTTSLVSLFEGKRGEDDVDPVKKRAPSVRTKNLDRDEQVSAERTPQEPQRAKPKPTPKPKPKPELATNPAGPGPSDEARESSQGMNRSGDTGRGDRSDGRGRSEEKPPQRRARSQNSEHKPAKKPKPAHRGSPTPPPPVPARTPSNHISSQPKKAIKTPRLKPPTPSVKTSSVTKMVEPIVQVTPVEPDEDQVDLFLGQSRTPKPRQVSQGSTSSNDTFVSASSVPSGAVSPTREADNTPHRPALPARSPSSRSISTPNPPRHPATQPSTPNLTLSSLTNAMMASNLAAARLTPTTPSQPPPLPAPRRSGRSPLQPHHTADSIRSQLTGGSKSPNHPNHQQKQRTGMLQTLRSPHTSLSDDEDARRQHHQRRRSKVLGGSNRKHAHHEGSRRRWRDEITVRERRRYEAVWASNKGLFLRPGWAAQYQNNNSLLPPGPGATGTTEEETHNQTRDRVEASRAGHGAEADLVVNVVARDIWSRSRLPADELAEVWDLVDRGARGALGRDEFVVGLWLIDQRLRGRKIPARVSQSVWDSAAGGHHGVVVPLPAGAGAGGGGGKKGRRGW